MSDMSLLTPESIAAIAQWLRKYPADQKRSALIAALTIAQQQNGGFLTDELMGAVADHLELPRMWAYEVGSFYSMLDLEPVGRNKVSICNNISCMLRGADKIVSHVEERLGIKRGETTTDGRITLIKEEECLAGCCGAPMMVVNGHYHENLTTEEVDRLLDGLE